MEINLAATTSPYFLNSTYQGGTEGEVVFPGKKNGQLNHTKRSWQSLLKLATINHFRWHDMKHHFASQVVMGGVDLNTVRELLGYSDIQMTLRCAHLDPEHKTAAVGLLVKKL